MISANNWNSCACNSRSTLKSFVHRRLKLPRLPPLTDSESGHFKTTDRLPVPAQTVHAAAARRWRPSLTLKSLAVRYQPNDKTNASQLDSSLLAHHRYLSVA